MTYLLTVTACTLALRPANVLSDTPYMCEIAAGVYVYREPRVGSTLAAIETAPAAAGWTYVRRIHMTYVRTYV